ncbi:hypothetical protein D623_10003911 [Myotis brandtii]|uniref:Uncharacterized protein n=1 Tax=Myotis brandtii TaxID=109478 RepID=S7Q7P0_MYOBR|nr:hypothetical protein D623_10003911 [Myotis brandtii]
MAEAESRFEEGMDLPAPSCPSTDTPGGLPGPGLPPKRAPGLPLWFTSVLLAASPQRASAPQNVSTERPGDAPHPSALWVPEPQWWLNSTCKREKAEIQPTLPVPPSMTPSVTTNSPEVG